MQRGFRDSNWVNQLELTVFEDFNGKLYAECAALSLSLKSQGHMAAAASMMVKQLSETDSPSLTELCQDVAAFCEELDATKLPALLCRSAYTRLSMTEYASANRADQSWSVETVQRRSLAAIFGSDWSTFAPKLSARLQVNELNQSTAAPAEVAAALASIADRSIGGGDYGTANHALHSAVSASKTFANRAADQNSADLLRGNLSRLLDLHRQTTKSLYFEATALLELFFLTDLKVKAHEDILNEVARFDGRAPLFDVPVLHERLYSAAMSAARETSRDDLLEMYDRAHYKAYRESFPEESVPTTIVQVIARIQKDFRNTLDLGRNAVEIVLMWAKEECQSDVMSQLEWEELFGFYVLKNPERQSNAPFLGYLERVQRDYRSFSKLFFDVSRQDWGVQFSRLRGWLTKSNDKLPADSRRLVLSTIANAWSFKQRSDWAKQIHTDEENAQFMRHALADIDLVNEISSIDHAQATSMVGLPGTIRQKDENVFRVISQIKAGSLVEPLDATPREELTATALDQAIRDSEDVFQEYQKRQNYLGMFTVLRRQAEFLWNKFARFQTAQPEDAIAVLYRAEKVYNEVRHQRSVPLAHHYSIAGKMRQLRKYDAGDLYDKAICWNRIAWNVHLRSLVELQKKPIVAEEGQAATEERRARLKELDAAFQDSYAQFVSWTQKSKSRAIFDLLSLDSPIPPELLKECSQNPSATDMIRRESDLVQNLGQLPFPQLLDAKGELDKLRGEMRQHPLLKNVMRIRDGETINIIEITKMLQGLPDGVVLVDFIYVAFDQPLRALCYRKGLTYSPALMHDVSMDVLTAWTKNLTRPSKKPLGDVASGMEALYKLAPLLLPLFEVGKGSPNRNLGPVIRQGDTIVFCATGVLHNLPLHAIPIDGVPVIEKHPVVYCPSLTVLWHCLQMLRNPHEQKRLVLNPMGSYWDRAKSQPVQSTEVVKRLADTLSAKYLHGFGSSKHSIMDSLDGVAILHYHGHVHFTKGSAMKSYLVLDGVVEGNDDDDSLPSEKRLTAEDIFSCRLAKGALATIVGCLSGGADVSAADDVLGIPMAMYYAGAAAIVSSLWRLRDEDGAAWAHTFYDDLQKQRRECEQGGGHEQASAFENKKDAEKAASGYNIEKDDVTTKGNDAGQGDAAKRSEKGGPGGQGVALVNLALAMQRAVRRLRFDVDGQERAPYHWAGYVLSGSWIFPFTSGSKSI